MAELVIMFREVLEASLIIGILYTYLKKSNNDAILQASMDDNSASADIVDQASSYTEKNVEMRAINRQIKLIAKIDGALKKIQDGTYGFCEETAEPIGLSLIHI